MMTNEPLVAIRDLTKSYSGRKSFLGREAPPVRAVDGVSLDISPGETLALVGESGCGKSTLARLLVRLIQPSSGSVWYDGADIFALDADGLDRFRRRVQIVFQDPYGSLNPRMTVGAMLKEVLRVHRLQRNGSQGRHRVSELLEAVGLHADDASRYPHEFSGGQRQRLGIARALAVEPEFLVVDEPVSALDVSVQAQVLNLLIELQERLDLTYLFITHDLSVVRHVADRVAVMYMGQIMELADCDALYGNPRHPYTKALLSAVPSPDRRRPPQRVVLAADPKGASGGARGCPFQPRCPHPERGADCEGVRPKLELKGEGGWAACHKV